MNPPGRIAIPALLLFVWILMCEPASADSAHQSVLYEGRVGPYAARIGVRPPGVIPGLAAISIRVLEGEVTEITALPMKWNTGRNGAPPPDRAIPVRGETNLYATELWFMEGGAHGIEVTVRGSAGEGRVLVPMNSVATRVLPLPKALGIGLGLIGVILVALMASIVGAGVRESVLPPGDTPTRRRRWAARGAIVGATILMVALLWGGWRWWNAEANEYRNNRLYRPRALEAAVDAIAGASTLRLTLEEPNGRGLPPLVPDHGRLMHLFLVREPELDAFAHLHPVRVNRKVFEAILPPLPAGRYSIYAQVTHETGFAETLTNRVDLPEPIGTTSPTHAAPATPDPEDAWSSAVPTSSGPCNLGDSWLMEWQPTDPPIAREPLSLRFAVRHTEGRPANLQPYLGMLGHLALRSRDGRVFNHIHPSGSFSMAAQQLLELRENGGAPRKVQYGANDPTCQLPGLEASTAEWLSRKPMEPRGTLSFPCEFPEAGSYRLWVQVKLEGQIRTGVFDITVPDSGKRAQATPPPSRASMAKVDVQVPLKLSRN